MKSPLILLHGAIGASSQLTALAENLSDDYEIHLFDFPGHGGTSMPAKAFSLNVFSDALLKFIQDKNLQQPVIFGYSMGGYVALILAKEHPGLINRIITLGTKFYWDEETAAMEVKMMNAETIELKVPAFASALKKLHEPDDWKVVLKHTGDMLTAMGKHNPLQLTDYATLNIPVLILLGEKDKMVTIEETENVFNALPHAKMMVLPDTPHPIEQVNAGMLSLKIREF